MLKRFANIFVNLFEKYMPDPYLFAAILTVVVYILALILTNASPLKIVDMWAGGLWGLLVFTMQISIALVLCACVIRTGPVEAILKWFSGLATTPAKAYWITTFIGGVFALFSWAAGLIVSAFVAKEMAKNVKGCHYPLLVACGYSGMVIWHMGYTSSIGLVIATPGHFLEKMIGVIPVSQTVYAPFNYVTALFVLFTLPFVMMAIRPNEDEVKEADPALFAADDVEEVVDKSKWTFADKLENMRSINLVLGIAGVIYMVRYFTGGGGLTMDSTNMSFLVLAMLLNKTPRALIKNVVEGGRSLGPIVLQFPMYGGIMGMMVSSGLASVMAGWFVAISTPYTLPLWTFLSAGIVNMFVPSGGSQWAVQGPIMMEAAQRMGVSLPRVAMAVAWGDQWTNMIQPFWALPMLAIVGMKAKDIMGYCVMTLIWSGIVFSVSMLLPW